MSLTKLQEGLKKFTDDDKAIDIISYVNDFIDEQTAQYKQNKENNCLTFGKWKGFTMKEMAANEKGKSYIKWLLAQTWFSEDKFEDLFNDMRQCGLLKKI